MVRAWLATDDAKAASRVSPSNEVEGGMLEAGGWSELLLLLAGKDLIWPRRREEMQRGPWGYVYLLYCTVRTYSSSGRCSTR